MSPRVTESRRHDTFAVAILALVTTILFIDVLAGTHNFYLRDLARYYYPAKQMLRDIVLGGEFPYWNRLFSAGQPIAANPEHEVFYPLTWLILLPSYDLGYRLLVLSHVYIGVLGMYAMLRSMDLRVPAAAFGAISFALGGVYLSYVNLLPILFCVAWLPLTCLFVRRFMFTPNVGNFVLASLFFGMQFLVAEPTTILQTGFLLGMYALYRGWYAARDHGRSWKSAVPEMLTRVALVGAITIAALLLGAAQMFPAIDHARDSVRSRPFRYALVAEWHLPPARLAEFVYPNVFGHVTVNHTPRYWGRGLYYPRTGSFLYSIYPGLLAACLALAAILVRPRGSRFVLIVCAISFAIAFGPQTPLLKLLYDSGLVVSIRYMEKFFLLAAFALTVLAAQMFDGLVAGDRRIRTAGLIVAGTATAVAAVMALSGFREGYAEAFGLFWGVEDRVVAMASQLARRDWIVASIRGGILVALFGAIRVIPRRLWLGAVGIFVFTDLAAINAEINPRMPARFFRDEPPIVRRVFPSSRDAFRIFHAADWVQSSDQNATDYGRTGPASYWILRNGLFPVMPAAYGLATVLDVDYDRTALLPTADFTNAMWAVKRLGRKDWWQPFAAMSNVWYRGTYRSFQDETKRIGKNLSQAEPVEFTQVAAHPRYYFADQIVSIRTMPEFARRVAKGQFSERVAFVPMPAFDPAPGVVHAWRETSNTAILEVESAGRGFLVMSVTPHKYWNITLDGQPVRAVVTNIGYQGIPVPRGRHRIEMRYRNDLILVSVAVSIMTMAFLVAAALAARRRASGRHAASAATMTPP